MNRRLVLAAAPVGLLAACSGTGTPVPSTGTQQQIVTWYNVAQAGLIALGFVPGMAAAVPAATAALAALDAAYNAWVANSSSSTLLASLQAAIDSAFSFLSSQQSAVKAQARLGLIHPPS